MTRAERQVFERKVTNLSRQMQCGRWVCRMAVNYAPDDVKMQIAYLRATYNIVPASADVETFDDMVRYFYEA